MNKKAPERVERIQTQEITVTKSSLRASNLQTETLKASAGKQTLCERFSLTGPINRSNRTKLWFFLFCSDDLKDVWISEDASEPSLTLSLLYCREEAAWHLINCLQWCHSVCIMGNVVQRVHPKKFKNSYYSHCSSVDREGKLNVPEEIVVFWGKMIICESEPEQRGRNEKLLHQNKLQPSSSSRFSLRSDSVILRFWSCQEVNQNETAWAKTNR